MSIESQSEFQHIPEGGGTNQELMKQYGNEIIQLLNCINGTLFGLAYKLTGNKEDAKDLLSETILRVCLKIHTYEPKDAFGSWVNKVLIGMYYIQLRAEDTIKRTQTNERRELQEDHIELNIERVLDYEVFRNIVFDMTKKWRSERHPRLLELLIEGYTYEEMREILSKEFNEPISINYVCGSINQIKNKILKEINRKFGIDIKSDGTFDNLDITPLLEKWGY